MLSFCFTNGVGQALVNWSEVVEAHGPGGQQAWGRTVLAHSYLQCDLGWPNLLLLQPPYQYGDGNTCFVGRSGA